MFSKICYFALFALSAYALKPGSIPEFSREKYREIRQKCVNESGIVLEYLYENSTSVIEAERTFKCFNSCMMREHLVMNADGTLNTEVAILQLDDDLPEETKEKYTQAFRNCGSKKAEDDCETFYVIKKCIYQSANVSRIWSPLLL